MSWDTAALQRRASHTHLTCFQYPSMEQSRVEKGLVFTWADLRSHEFGVGGEYSCALLVQVHPGHGGHVVDVVIVPETWEIRKLYTTENN